MNKYREYFVGGPLDGKEKGTEFPKVPDWGMIRAIDFAGTEIPLQSHVEISSPGIEWNYRQDAFTFGGIRVAFWTDHRLTSRELVSFRLAELIMEPHVDRRPEICVCTDSGHSRTGRCPSKTDSEYNMCPRRQFTESEIIQRNKPGKKVNLRKAAKL